MVRPPFGFWARDLLSAVQPDCDSTRVTSEKWGPHLMRKTDGEICTLGNELIARPG